MDEHETAQPGAEHSTAPIEHELEVAVSRTRAWDAYVHGLEEWWHPGWTAFGSGIDRIEVEPHPGARIVEHGRDGSDREWGEVLDAVPGHRFSHTFHLTHDGDPTIVTVEFDDLPQGGTRVRFSHGGWNETNQDARGTHADWPTLLERYRAHAQHV
ncbi:SRPBCC domain-containing protein [Agrococcus baldri]|nr:SRPBCC domain-containing protein [Agrococcus baldri]